MPIVVRTGAQRAEEHPTVFAVEATEDEFRSQVLSHVYDMNLWHGHMRRVEQDKVSPDIPDADKHQAYPPPHPQGPLAELVRQCVKSDDGVASPDYDIVTPPPAPQPDPKEAFEAKRQKLLTELRRAEAAAQEAIIHPNKTRLFNLQSAAALRVPEDQRTDEHRATIERAQGYVKQHEAIAWHFARQEAVLADLTPETIDGFNIEAFHG